MVKVIQISNWPGGLSYLQGEVTAEDVVVGEIETQENLDERWPSISSKKVVSLTEELRELLGMTLLAGNECTYVTGYRGIITLTAHKHTEKKTERALNLLRTRHENEMKENFTQEKVDEAIQRIVDMANRRIEDSQRKMTDIIADNASNFRWDNTEQLDKRAAQCDKLRKKIREFQREMEGIMKGELDEWMTGQGLTEELKASIMNRARFGGYIPETLELETRSSRRRRR